MNCKVAKSLFQRYILGHSGELALPLVCPEVQSVPPPQTFLYHGQMGKVVLSLATSSI